MKCKKCKTKITRKDKICPNCGEKNGDGFLISLLQLLNTFLFLAILWLLLEPSFRCMVRTEIHEQWKPIIYIYPTEEIKVEIKVSHPENFTVTYPKYENGWKVLAKEDGTLIDENGRSYYALYWEGEKQEKNLIKEDGFVVKGEEVVNFLEEKLEILGLNEREADEFIVYWLPKLEKNKYNYIRFQTLEEINDTMKLDITPEPETLIRVMMEYKPLEKEIKVKEQVLEKVERKGYTVVEWGGTNVN